MFGISSFLNAIMKPSQCHSEAFVLPTRRLYLNCIVLTACLLPYYNHPDTRGKTKILSLNDKKIPKRFGNFRKSSYLCTSFQWKLANSTERASRGDDSPRCFYLNIPLLKKRHLRPFSYSHTSSISVPIFSLAIMALRMILSDAPLVLSMIIRFDCMSP